MNPRTWVAIQRDEDAESRDVAAVQRDEESATRDTKAAMRDQLSGRREYSLRARIWAAQGRTTLPPEPVRHAVLPFVEPGTILAELQGRLEQAEIDREVAATQREIAYDEVLGLLDPVALDRRNACDDRLASQRDREKAKADRRRAARARQSAEADREQAEIERNQVRVSGSRGRDEST